MNGNLQCNVLARGVTMGSRSRSLLVTGGCGFIGSNFLHQWARMYPEDALVNLDALTYAGNPKNVAALKQKNNYRFAKGDIRDPKAVANAMKGADVVVHFAAESHVDRSIEGPLAFVRTNVEGTLVLLDEARKKDVARFHHVSTDEVFGDLPIDSTERFTEGTRYDPHSPYAASKAASDHLVRAYGRTYGLKFTITNGSNNFGPYQHPEKAIPRFITNLILGTKIPLYGSGKNVRDWLHVYDYCSAIELVLTKGKVGETYCIGGDNQLDNLTLAKKIGAAFGRGEDAIEHVKDRPGHDRRYALDSTKARTELAWRPTRTFDAALHETIAWYRANEAWWKPLVQDAPRTKKGLTR